MRFLLTPIGSAGDVHPYLGLGLALQARGHQATIATNPHFEDLIRRTGLDFAPVGTSDQFDAFLADPAKYVPQYGGFCAFAVSRGATAAVDPQAFTIVDGKLYLNFTKRVRSIWQTDIPGNISKADANWPGLSGE